MERSSPSERRVLYRSITIYSGEHPSRSFPYEDVGGVGEVNLTGDDLQSNAVRYGEGFDLTDFVFFLNDSRSLEGTTEALSGGEDRLLRVVGNLGGAVFGCREARPLVERWGMHVEEGSGLSS